MKRKLDPNKIYAFIGRAVVYTMCYIGLEVLIYWGFLQSTIYRQEENMELFKEILFWWLLIYDIAVITIKPIRKDLIDFLKDIGD